ncbi:hypothetical protein [Lactiplantibacillus pentosus]|uniref:hypothetical protein n=1 Tax=Lactiplantibacillus pentosus TaxID=1589 RepID=UPI001B37CDB6|nr:hypothetical protein [Lactiplantibacillus pentosus]MBQ0837895.1 hypothetical protein [Lactiplantibacillus pentosus]MBU7464080.1 hypothetical protein [Lactiplantibacillus pentosus]MBU7490487.1 hypothetical protein [Lactiplantibacillus pentosus]MBU7492146.1 hypothetical protein [Lactiplantibacillus pentosus]MBU7518000.1 hypothetical protein [Lactiplantibacillus pentosus]
MLKSVRIRLEFNAEVLRNEIFDVHDFASFQNFWQRFENFLADRMVIGHLNVLEGHGLIPSDFKDVDGQLAYQVGEDDYQIAYDQIAREWTVTIR